jgi:hypothetical protein
MEMGRALDDRDDSWAEVEEEDDEEEEEDEDSPSLP